MSLGYQSNTANVNTSNSISTSASRGLNPPNTNPSYANYNNRPNTSIGVSTLRQSATLADRPTTADARKGTKDLAAALAQVGNAAAFLQNMYSMMSRVSAVAAGGSQTSRKKVIEEALSGAFYILSNKYGYDKLVRVLDNALAGDKFNGIDEVYKDVVTNAIANLFKAALKYGTENLPVYEYIIVTELGPTPSPVVTEVPDLYVKEYFSFDEDPYPGYIKWTSEDETTYVYEQRKIGDRYYTSVQEEIYSIAEQELTEGLDPYIRDENLTAKILNDLLIEQEAHIEANTNENTLGKGTGADSANAAQLIMALIQYISTMTNGQRNGQLPNSVLNTSSISNTLSSHERRLAELKKMKDMLKKAAIPPQLGSLLTNLLGSLGGGNISGQTNIINNISSLLNVSNISGIISNNGVTSVTTSNGANTTPIRIPSIFRNTSS